MQLPSQTEWKESSSKICQKGATAREGRRDESDKQSPPYCSREATFVGNGLALRVDPSQGTECQAMTTAGNICDNSTRRREKRPMGVVSQELHPGRTAKSEKRNLRSEGRTQAIGGAGTEKRHFERGGANTGDVRVLSTSHGGCRWRSKELMATATATASRDHVGSGGLRGVRGKAGGSRQGVLPAQEVRRSGG